MDNSRSGRHLASPHPRLSTKRIYHILTAKNKTFNSGIVIFLIQGGTTIGQDVKVFSNGFNILATFLSVHLPGNNSAKAHAHMMREILGTVTNTSDFKNIVMRSNPIST
jgi:hypothetical protein